MKHSSSLRLFVIWAPALLLGACSEFDSIDWDDLADPVTPNPSQLCGGLQGLSCAKGEFCLFEVETSCGAGDQSGLCQPLPEFCTEEYSPVCGCDGSTHGNECAAHASGTSVASRGECGGSDPEPEPLAEGDVCGGFRPPNAPRCGDELFCQHQPGSQCGAADLPGQCVAIPDNCPNSNALVCGCDGVTYESRCNAALAQVGILNEGPCD